LREGGGIKKIDFRKKIDAILPHPHDLTPYSPQQSDLLNRTQQHPDALAFLTILYDSLLLDFHLPAANIL
jgi:hypothetical protein